MICRPLDNALPKVSLWKRLGQAFRDRFPVVKERMYYLPTDKFEGKVGDVILLHDGQPVYVIGLVDIDFMLINRSAPESRDRPAYEGFIKD